MTPPSSGPTAIATEKTALASALPSRSNPAGVVTASVATRTSDRVVSVASPAMVTITSSGAIGIVFATSPNATATPACAANRPERTHRDGRWSSRATSHGENSAGANVEHRK